MIEAKYKIGFSDCDPAGIIFYSRIFEYCHKAYEELINSFNLEENYWSNKEYLVPIINSSSKYIKPLKYNDEIIIKLSIANLKNSSFEIGYEVYNTHELSVLVSTIHVFINPNSWRKIEIPIHLRKHFIEHLKKEDSNRFRY